MTASIHLATPQQYSSFEYRFRNSFSLVSPRGSALVVQQATPLGVSSLHQAPGLSFVLEGRGPVTILPFQSVILCLADLQFSAQKAIAHLCSATVIHDGEEEAEVPSHGANPSLSYRKALLSPP